MRRMLLVAVVVLALTPAFFTAGLLLAQPGGAGRGPGGPGGPGFLGGGPGAAMGSGLLNLVTRQDVQEELQLVDEQRDKLEEVVNEGRERIGNQMRDMFSQMADLGPEERQARFDEIRTRFEKLNSEAEADLKKALLPHQFERLKQISVQQRIQAQGASALTSGDLAEALDLTDEQREKLEQRAAEVNRELQEKIAQLRVEARNKMLDVLTPEQRAKMESLMGDAFALRDGGFGGGFGGIQFRGFGGQAGGQQRGGRDRGDNQRRTNGNN